MRAPIYLVSERAGQHSRFLDIFKIQYNLTWQGTTFIVLMIYLILVILARGIIRFAEEMYACKGMPVLLREVRHKCSEGQQLRAIQHKPSYTVD